MHSPENGKWDCWHALLAADMLYLLLRPYNCVRHKALTSDKLLSVLELGPPCTSFGALVCEGVLPVCSMPSWAPAAEEHSSMLSSSWLSSCVPNSCSNMETAVQGCHRSARARTHAHIHRESTYTNTLRLRWQAFWNMCTQDLDVQVCELDTRETFANRTRKEYAHRHMIR